jgi:hypothetical protein
MDRRITTGPSMGQSTAARAGTISCHAERETNTYSAVVERITYLEWASFILYYFNWPRYIGGDGDGTASRSRVAVCHRWCKAARVHLPWAAGSPVKVLQVLGMCKRACA